jgi:hypothetical protein
VESSLPDVQRDDELRYVTKHFADLQGLRMAPLWAAFVLLSALEYSQAISRRQALEISLGMLALALGWMVVAGRWYQRRYGLVTPREERESSRILSIIETDRRSPKVSGGWWFAVCTLVLTLFLADLFQFRPNGSYNGFGGFGAVGLSIFLLNNACFADGTSSFLRRRRLLARGGIAMIVVFHIGFLLGRLGPWQYMGVTSMVLLLATLYDHWLLTSLLSGHGEGRDE